MKCISCGVQALVDDRYCDCCRRFKDHLDAVKEKMNIRKCPKVHSTDDDGEEIICKGEMSFHNRYWRIGMIDDDKELREAYSIDRLLIENIWICDECGYYKIKPDSQKTIDEYNKK